MIVHLATNQTGGAATAARRLHDGLRSHGVQSRFLTANGTADVQQGMEVMPKQYPRFWHPLTHKLGIARNADQKWQKTLKKIQIGNLFATGLDSTFCVHETASVSEAKILNLHWVPGMISWNSFFHQSHCPMVWTLHDMNPFLGIFHYTVDRDRASQPAKQFDTEVLAKKMSLFKTLRNKPVIVTPSKWLGEQSKNSDLFGDLRHEHIPYGLNTDVFKVYPQTFARSVFGLPTDRRLLLIVAERLDDYRKGFDLLVDAMNQMDVPSDIELVAVGSGQIPIQTMKCHRIGPIHDERLMALLYASADFTAITSREDNQPNVILESLCCGTPVIGTPAGGIPEPIVVPTDGLVAQHCSATSIAQTLEQSFSVSFQREKIAASAAQRFGAEVTAKRYQQLYDSILENQ